MDTTQTPQLEGQEIVAFKIWYSDSTYTSNDGRWDEAPSDDVQFVMLYFKKRDGLGRHTRLYSAGCDYYALDDTGKFTSHFDEIEQVRGHILYGRFMEYNKHIEIGKQAYLDYGDDLKDKPINQLIQWQPTT